MHYKSLTDFENSLVNAFLDKATAFCNNVNDEYQFQKDEDEESYSIYKHDFLEIMNEKVQPPIPATFKDILIHFIHFAEWISDRMGFYSAHEVKGDCYKHRYEILQEFYEEWEEVEDLLHRIKGLVESMDPADDVKFTW